MNLLSMKKECRFVETPSPLLPIIEATSANQLQKMEKLKSNVMLIDVTLVTILPVGNDLFTTLGFCRSSSDMHFNALCWCRIVRRVHRRMKLNDCNSVATSWTRILQRVSTLDSRRIILTSYFCCFISDFNRKKKKTRCNQLKTIFHFTRNSCHNEIRSIENFVRI